MMLHYYDLTESTISLNRLFLWSLKHLNSCSWTHGVLIQNFTISAIWCQCHQLKWVSCSSVNSDALLIVYMNIYQFLFVNDIVISYYEQTMFIMTLFAGEVVSSRPLLLTSSSTTLRVSAFQGAFVGFDFCLLSLVGCFLYYSGLSCNTFLPPPKKTYASTSMHFCFLCVWSLAYFIIITLFTSFIFELLKSIRSAGWPCKKWQVQVLDGNQSWSPFLLEQSHRCSWQARYS